MRVSVTCEQYLEICEAIMIRIVLFAESWVCVQISSEESAFHQSLKPILDKESHHGSKSQSAAYKLHQDNEFTQKVCAGPCTRSPDPEPIPFAILKAKPAHRCIDELFWLLCH